MNYIKLFFLRLVVGYRNLVEFFRVAYFYYPNRQFKRVDLYLLRCYILENPYRISKKTLQEKGSKDIYAYGETPLTTMEKISKKCQINTADVVYELGSGRGRTCFWLHFFVGCQVVGVEFVPIFVKIAQKVKHRFDVRGVKFIYQDILDVDYADATVIYFYGTSSDTPFIEKLIEKLKGLPSGTKIITVSYPLTAYTKQPLFKLIKSFPAQFSWGEAEVYLQVVNSSHKN
ncbi:MAG: hypothetical protein K940chlam7_01672 [Chlamydiae bacterium]|nr:hypothetical protein [Chlamydiota bacterium]